MPIYDNKKVNDALIDICDLNSDLPENSESIEHQNIEDLRVIFK